MDARRWPILALAPLVGAGLCGPVPPAPPDQPGDCEDGVAAPSVQLGLGETGFTPVARDQATVPVFGPQGGSHVWTAVRATGFGTALVDVEVEATDAFGGPSLGRGAAYEVHLNQLEGAPAGDCDYHGMPLFLFQRPIGGSSGLARVVATVRARDGRSATAEARYWLGDTVPQCVPAEGLAPTVAPRHDVENFAEVPWRLVADGDTLVADPAVGTGAPRLLIGAQLAGLASSATKLHAELRDPQDAAAPPLASGDASPGADDAPYRTIPELGRACAPTHHVELAVGTDLAGRELRLVLDADDGLGHRASATRVVKVRWP